jgi:hypothetical protein
VRTMKKSEVEKHLIAGTEVAIVQSENFSPYFGVVTAMHAPRRVHHGSRDFRGSMVNDGVEVTFENGNKQVYPLNQIKDAQETREAQQNKHDRRKSLESSAQQSLERCNAAAASLKATIEENTGETLSPYAIEVKGNGFSNGSYYQPTTAYNVVLSAGVAETLASVLA